MNITDVRIRPVNYSGNTKAFASVTLDDSFVVHDLRVVHGRYGLFVSMPFKKVGDQFFDISHPITSEAHERITQAVLQEYQHSLVSQSGMSAQ